jgi:DNA phosphorothioation-associated putative methyltransferase
VVQAGKRVGKRVYVSVAQLDVMEQSYRELVTRAEAIASAELSGAFNVLRIDAEAEEVAFLHYPDLGRDPFPSLDRSWRVDVRTQLVTRRSYVNSLNPPILHRTELLLSPEHPARAKCEALSAACESVGLFEDPTIIGYKNQWHALIQEHAFVLDGFELVPLANAVPQESSDGEGNSDSEHVARHLTALARTTLSAPLQSLLRDALLTTTSTFFDYGCGRGDDIATLSASGFTAVGWDPHFCPRAERIPADVVNLGFVINVIEDREERVSALEGAFALAGKVLSVAAMIGTNDASKGRPCNDGVLTSRNTFQKYFSQGDLRAFIESVLDEEAYPAAPGVFYVFRDRAVEQAYLVARSRNTSRVERLLRPSFVPRLRVPQEASRKRGSSSGRPPVATRIDSTAGQEQLLTLWRTILELGRVPDTEEIPNAVGLRLHFGSTKRAIEACLERNDPIALRRATQGRRDDILVMLALRTFDRRRKFQRLEPRLAKDIRQFFGTLGNAEAEATQLLFSLQDTAVVGKCCEEAASEGLGWLVPGESLQLHSSLVERLPAPLRIYVGCSAVMAGDVSRFDLVKAHISSGKVSLISYDDFVNKSLPLMLRRVKVNLREQTVDVFDYSGLHAPTVLWRKSRYINEEFPNYALQVDFDAQLEALRLFDLDAYGPDEATVRTELAGRRFEVVGFKLLRSQDIPDIDGKCGRNFRYRDLLECGETWQSLRLPNLPASAESYNALNDLAFKILDPVVEYFGPIELTYAFASPALTRHIKRRISPGLDQHAAHEVSRSGRLVCERRGAAVDFLVRDEDMREVAKWIARNCQFDRMYFYGATKPIHVSIGPDNSATVYRLDERGSRRIPRHVDVDSL